MSRFRLNPLRLLFAFVLATVIMGTLLYVSWFNAPEPSQEYCSDSSVRISCGPASDIYTKPFGLRVLRAATTDGVSEIDINWISLSVGFAASFVAYYGLLSGYDKLRFRSQDQ